MLPGSLPGAGPRQGEEIQSRSTRVDKRSHHTSVCTGHVRAQTLLAYPDGCTLGETVFDPETGDVLVQAPSLTGEKLYPKEQALVDLVAAERLQGRRVLVYVTHPGTQDKRAFDQLHAQREAIERELRESPTWERLDESVASRMAVYREGSIDSPDDHLDEIQRWAVNLLPKFRGTLEPRVRALDLDVPHPAAIGGVTTARPGTRLSRASPSLVSGASAGGA